MGSFGLRNTF